jgi:hypothetical protein
VRWSGEATGIVLLVQTVRQNASLLLIQIRFFHRTNPHLP